MAARHDVDEAVVVAYVTGELDEVERLRFEQRLAAEPALARSLLAFEVMDLAGDSVRARSSAAASPPRARVRTHAWLLAAAAVILAAIVWWPSNGAIPCHLRAVASRGAGDFASYAEQIGLPSDVRYVGELRGGNPPAGGVSAMQFLTAVAAREAERAEQAFAAPQQALGDAFFTLRVQVDRECYALVLLLDAGGRWFRRFPARADAPVFGEISNPLSPGTHTLPRPVVMPNAIGTLSLYPGIDVPSDVASNRAWVVLALGEGAIQTEALAELDRLLGRDAEPLGGAATTPGAVEAWVERRSRAVLAWLTAHGFTAHRLPVQRS